MPEDQIPEDEVPTGVSMTALWVAQVRAQESTRPERLFEDSLAQAFIDAVGSTTPLTIDDLLEESQSDMSELDAIHRRFLDYVALRTKFFDDYLLQACAAGCRQVAVLAAGLDTRAFRLSWPQGTRLFELDLPEIFTFKEQVLTREGAEPVCQRIVVEADLSEEWSAPLLQADFRAAELTAWLAEGILIYLTEEENDQLLSKINELSTSGSHLAFEHMKRDAQELEPFRVAADALAELGVSWKSLLANPEEWLAHYGWKGQVFDSADLAAMYDRPLSWYGGLAETETAIEWLVRAVREAS